MIGVLNRVSKLMLLAKRLTGEIVACLLVESLSTEFAIASDLIIAAMHDRASVNSVAICTVSVVCNRTFDVGCLSHTIDHVGERLVSKF